MSNVALATAVVAGAAFVSFAPAANAVTIFTTSGEGTQYSLGAAGSYQHTSPWDQLTVFNGTGNFQLGLITLNSVKLSVGINADVPNPTNPGWINETMTVTGLGSPNTPLNIPFNLAISYSDTLTIFGGTTLYFPGYRVVVDTLLFPAIRTGGSWTENLTAQVYANPLPGALPLFATGLGALGLLGWRRKRKNAAAIAAA